jgi:hypothetical protein
MLEQVSLSYGMPLAYIALAVAVLTAVAFPLIQMVKDLKKARITLMGVGVLVLIFVLCYSLAVSESVTKGEIFVSASQMKVVEAGLYMFYCVLLLSILSILYSSVSRYFK